MALVMVGLEAADSKLPPDGNRMKKDHAPTPFTAEEIRLGCPDGRKTKYKIEIPGKPFHYQITTFVNATPETAGFEMTTLDKDGNTIGQMQTATATWSELQTHASFPQSRTKIENASYTTAAGAFDCWYYHVTGEKDGKPVISKYYFAKKLPGPPIYFIQETDGSPTFTMTLVENKQ